MDELPASYLYAIILNIYIQIATLSEIQNPRYEYIPQITVTGKTAVEMTGRHGFSAKQQEMLDELLPPENDDLWASLLVGIPSGDSTGTIYLGIYS